MLKYLSILFLFLSCVSPRNRSIREVITHRCDPKLTDQKSGLTSGDNFWITKKDSSSVNITPHNLPWDRSSKPIFVSQHSIELIDVIPNINTKDYQIHRPPSEKYAWDFVLSYGQEIRASHSGTIRLARKGFGRGSCSKLDAETSNFVIVYWDDDSGRESLYLHLKDLAPGIVPGKKVTRGEVIGHAGNSGWVCPTPDSSNPTGGTHLHYQVQSGAKGGDDQRTSYYLNSIKAPFTEINTVEKLKAHYFTSEMNIQPSEGSTASPPSPDNIENSGENKPPATSNEVSPVPGQYTPNNSSDACPR